MKNIILKNNIEKYIKRFAGVKRGFFKSAPLVWVWERRS